LNGYVTLTQITQNFKKPRTQICSGHVNKIRIRHDTTSRFITRNRVNAILYNL